MKSKRTMTEQEKNWCVAIVKQTGSLHIASRALNRTKISITAIIYRKSIKLKDLMSFTQKFKKETINENDLQQIKEYLLNDKTILDISKNIGVNPDFCADFIEKEFGKESLLKMKMPELPNKFETLDIISKNPDHKYRSCLCCRNKFLSDWKGNRICLRCKNNENYDENYFNSDTYSMSGG